MDKLHVVFQAGLDQIFHTMIVDPIQQVVLDKMLHTGSAVDDHIRLYAVKGEKGFFVGNISLDAENAVAKQLRMGFPKVIHH